MCEPVQLQRDPFARATLVRGIIPRGERKPCLWCGAHEDRSKYRYGWQPDYAYAHRTPHLDGPFCSVGCFRTYMGG